MAALVISLALLSGFQTHVRGRLLEETPHLQVSPAGRGVFRAADDVVRKLASIPGVTETTPVVRGRVWVALRGQVDTAEAVGRPGEKGLELELAQAGRIGAYPGDDVKLVSSRTRLSPLGPIPIVAELRVTTLAPRSTARRGAEVTLPLAEARRLFALPDDAATGYEVRLRHPERAAEAGRDVEARLGANVTTKTWEEANRSLVLALKLERIVLFATVFLIVVVAGLNLAATSAMLAATRAGDAAVLAVLGASPRLVASVFLAAGGAIGVVGTLAGLAVGTATATLLDRTGAIPLPAQLYSLSSVPFRVDVLDLALVLVLSIGWSLLVASFPARTAARRDPSEALRAA